MINLLFVHGQTEAGRVCVSHLNYVTEQGDVVAYGPPELLNPDAVQGVDFFNDVGFVIEGWAGWTVANIINNLHLNFGGVDRTISVWTIPEGAAPPPKKREYTPSNWATPVPLP